MADPKIEYLKIQKLLYQEYHINCESMLTIMKKYSIPSTRTMDILFREFEIEARSWGEATSLALQTGRTKTVPVNTFSSKQQWHKTWDNRDVFLRSSYELALALELDEQRVKYDTECMRIMYFDTKQNRYRIAIPDFYLPESNTIIEVKATYWLDEENMNDKSKEYQRLGFNFILKVDGEVVGAAGIEPATTTLKESCSTD